MTATGQVAGTAAAMATERNCSPRDIYKTAVTELQQKLLKDGCYLMTIKNHDPKDLALSSKTSAPAVINGWNRDSRNLPKSADWKGVIELELKEKSAVSEVHLTVNRQLYKALFEIEGMVAGNWKQLVSVKADPEVISRRHVFNFPPEEITALRCKLIESSIPLKVCEIRIYE